MSVVQRNVHFLTDLQPPPHQQENLLEPPKEPFEYVKYFVIS